jgi:hypothetical protein
MHSLLGGFLKLNVELILNFFLYSHYSLRYNAKGNLDFLNIQWKKELKVIVKKTQGDPGVYRLTVKLGRQCSIQINSAKRKIF